MKARCVFRMLSWFTAGLQLFSLVAYGKVYPNGWEHSDPPPGDEFLTNRFGRTWSEPIYNGYLLVDDHYVDAPYVVEQRGFVIFVNGERVADGVDIRCVLPLPPPPAVTNDPGYPPGITKETLGGLAVSHPVYNAKRRYFDYLGLTGEERIQAELEYMRHLPCISNIVPRPVEGELTNRFMVYDYSGERFGTTFAIGPMGPPPKYEDEKMCEHIYNSRADISGLLCNNNFTHIRNGGLIGNETAFLSTNMWRETFEVLVSNLTPAARLAKLQAKGYFHEYTLDTVRLDHPFDGFKPTTQLWQRLSGDMSWTNDAPGRMLALTNGWQKIEPAFMRTQTVTVATVVANATQMPTVSTTESNPPVRVRPLAEIKPEPEHTPNSSSTISWGFLIGLAVIVVGLVFVYKRSPRQR